MFLKDPFKKLFWGANRITWVTLACILIGFVIAYGEIFLEYSYNILEKIFKKSSNLKKKSSYYFIKVHVENLAKMSFSKKLKSIYKSFLLLKKKCYSL